MRNILLLSVMMSLIFWRGASAMRTQDTNTPLWEVCKIAEPRDLSWEYGWRWRAEQNLSCLIDRLNRSVPSTPDKGVVTFSHNEIRQLVSLAWAGRDAAQRIGR